MGFATTEILRLKDRLTTSRMKIAPPKDDLRRPSAEVDPKLIASACDHCTAGQMCVTWLQENNEMIKELMGIDKSDTRKIEKRGRDETITSGRGFNSKKPWTPSPISDTPTLINSSKLPLWTSKTRQKMPISHGLIIQAFWSHERFQHIPSQQNDAAGFGSEYGAPEAGLTKMRRLRFGIRSAPIPAEVAAVHSNGDLASIQPWHKSKMPRMKASALILQIKSDANMLPWKQVKGSGGEGKER
nr:hypothetical protein DM860_011880 [Ipomoea batatas]